METLLTFYGEKISVQKREMLNSNNFNIIKIFGWEPIPFFKQKFFCVEKGIGFHPNILII
jgi:hypothetical protein